MQEIKSNYRSMGIKKNGKVYKDFVHNAYFKRIGTIPSKFQTFIYKKQNKNIFGSQTPRFQQFKNQLPGPGYYHPQKLFTLSNSKNSISLSKKGYGPLISKDSKQNEKYFLKNRVPGVGSYQLNPKIIRSNSASSFLKYNKPVQNIKFQKFQFMPGPGSYNVQTKPNIKSLCVFKNNSNRLKIQNQTQKTNVGPQSYKINMDFFRKKQFSLCPLFYFRQKKKLHSDYLESYLNNMEKIQYQPGPADYDNLLKPSLKCNTLIKQGVLDRFGQLIPECKQLRQKVHKQFPGPCNYNIQNSENVRKKSFNIKYKNKQ